MKRVLTTVLGAGLLLAGCGQNTPAATSPSGTPVATYGDGLDHSWTASTAEGQRLYAALSQGLKAQDFNIGLSITATSGWGPIELNTSNGETPAGDGKPITLNGKVYSTGLGLHANSEIHVHATNLETPACTRFMADVGLDDEVGDKGSVVFQVFADGVKLFDSGVMTGASATQHIDVGIGNKSDLRFVVTDAGDNNYYDHADWAGASLNCSAPSAMPSVTLDTTSLNIYHLHTGTLHATFHNYPKGPVQLQLAVDPAGISDPSNAGSTRTPYPVVLQTTQVELSGTPDEVKDIVIAAPTKPITHDAYDDRFFLNISTSGATSTRLPVSLVELPIKFTAQFEPAVLVGNPGETKTTVLTITADPPLDNVQSLRLDFGQNRIDDYFSVNPIGTVSGNGSVMRMTYAVSFLTKSPFPFPVRFKLDTGIAIGTITTGYRDPFYGAMPQTVLDLTLLPQN